MPIINALYEVIFENVSKGEALTNLMYYVSNSGYEIP